MKLVSLTKKSEISLSPNRRENSLVGQSENSLGLRAKVKIVWAYVFLQGTPTCRLIKLLFSFDWTTLGSLFETWVPLDPKCRLMKLLHLHVLTSHGLTQLVKSRSVYLYATLHVTARWADALIT